MNSIFVINKSNVDLEKIKAKSKSKSNSNPNFNYNINNPFVVNSTLNIYGLQQTPIISSNPHDPVNKFVIGNKQPNQNIKDKSKKTVNPEPKPKPEPNTNKKENKPDQEPVEKPVETNKPGIKKNYYWEYGNSGLKIKDFNSVMSKNLAILYYIDQIFNSYNTSSLNSSVGCLFDPKTNICYNHESNILQSENGNVQIKLSNEKIEGNYQVVAAGRILLSSIKLTDEDISKNKIPNFDSIMDHSDNPKHVLKLLQILPLLNVTNPDFKINIKENNSNPNFNFENIVESISELVLNYKKDNKEKNLLKSNSETAFYIKIYPDHSKALVTDNKNNLIFYICESTDYKKLEIDIRYYTLKINSKCKITKI